MAYKAILPYQNQLTRWIGTGISPKRLQLKKLKVGRKVRLEIKKDGGVGSRKFSMRNAEVVGRYDNYIRFKIHGLYIIYYESFLRSDLVIGKVGWEVKY